MPGRLVVGVGSHHGRDQLGWSVVTRLGQILGPAVAARCARSPEDLLDWLDGVVDLHIVDAFCGGAQHECLNQWRWPELPELLSTDRLSTHATDVRSILSLAQELNLLPRHVSVWGINVRAGPFAADDANNDNLLSAVAIDRLAHELAERMTRA